MHFDLDKIKIVEIYSKHPLFFSGVQMGLHKIQEFKQNQIIK